MQSMDGNRVMDSREFAAGVAATRRELAAARKATKAVTPRERKAQQWKGLGVLLDKGILSLKSYRRCQHTLSMEGTK